MNQSRVTAASGSFSTQSAELGLIIGDAIHNLRSALDHRVWELVSPHCTESERKQIQFPFSKSGSAEDIKTRFEARKIHRAAPQVWDALEALKPYPGGDDDLALIHELDVIDKHKLLVPSADYTQISGEHIRKLLPDFPSGIGVNTFSGNGRDVGWRIPKLNRRDRRARGIGGGGEKNLPVPVEVVIRETGEAPTRPLMPLLYAMTEAVERALGDLRKL